MKEKMCELAVILADLENTIRELYSKKEWLTIEELATLLNICCTSIATFKDRPAFQQFTKNTTYGCRIRNCPEAINLMRNYKYRNFEYEQEFLKNQATE